METLGSLSNRDEETRLGGKRHRCDLQRPFLSVSDRDPKAPFRGMNTPMRGHDCRTLVYAELLTDVRIMSIPCLHID